MLHAVNRTLVEAIHRRHRLSLTHNGRQRLAEPQCYGIGHRGTALLRMHQLAGGTEREPLFDVANITDLTALDHEHFRRPGPNYKRGDSAMKTIFAQLDDAEQV